MDVIRDLSCAAADPTEEEIQAQLRADAVHAIKEQRLRSTVCKAIKEVLVANKPYPNTIEIAPNVWLIPGFPSNGTTYMGMDIVNSGVNLTGFQFKLSHNPGHSS
jgi:hypothetical protein